MNVCLAMVEIEEGDDGMSEVWKDNRSVLKLPSSVFGSTVEEPVGLLYRAIPPVGPQPSWDPDIVAGIDDDFDFENPDNQLEDDFVVHASQSAEETNMLSDELSDSDMTTEFVDDYEETKSQFTNYSLTSSVIRRNNQLTLLDDKFERVSCIRDGYFRILRYSTINFDLFSIPEFQMHELVLKLNFFFIDSFTSSFITISCT